MVDSAPVVIPMTYDMPCETFRFAWRNERFVFARFSVSSRPGRSDRTGSRGEKVAQKRSQGLRIVSARNFVRAIGAAAAGRVSGREAPLPPPLKHGDKCPCKLHAAPPSAPCPLRCAAETRGGRSVWAP